MIDAALKALCTQTVTIAPWASQNANGEGAYGAPVAYSAQVSGVNKLIVDQTGQQLVASLKVVLYGAPNVSPKDLITLPADYTPQQPPILAVAKHTDERGPHHTELMLR